MKKLFRLITYLFLGYLLYFSIKDSPVKSVSYTPNSPPDLIGPIARNEKLKSAELIAQGKLRGPEATEIDREGNIYAVDESGSVKKIFPDGKIEDFAKTGGRPLGLRFGKDGYLYVCDTYQGLLKIDPTGKVETLTNSADELKFGFTDDLDVASDGTIYFTDASSKFHYGEHYLDLMETKPYGRFLKYDPKTKETKVLIPNIYFANGVALSKNEDFVIINETYRYRILRYWISGKKAGEAEVFTDNLPGFPDNVTSDGRGNFYLALFTIRNPLLDQIHPYPIIKEIIPKLPKMFWPKPKKYGFVLVLDEEGKYKNSYQEPSGTHLWEITSARYHEGFLYLGSLHNDRIGKIKAEE